MADLNPAIKSAAEMLLKTMQRHGVKSLELRIPIPSRDEATMKFDEMLVRVYPLLRED